MHWQGLSVGNGSNDNRLRIGERIDWMGCHSDPLELQMTELLALLEQIDLVTLNVLISWLILLMLWTLWTLLERTGLQTVDGLTSWLTLLTLQKLCPVQLE